MFFPEMGLLPPTSDKGQQIFSGGSHKPPLAAGHLSVQGALMPMHVPCQKPEVLRNCPPRLHQLICMRKAAGVDPLQEPPPYLHWRFRH